MCRTTSGSTVCKLVLRQTIKNWLLKTFKLKGTSKALSVSRQLDRLPAILSVKLIRSELFRSRRRLAQIHTQAIRHTIHETKFMRPNWIRSKIPRSSKEKSNWIRYTLVCLFTEFDRRGLCTHYTARRSVHVQLPRSAESLSQNFRLFRACRYSDFMHCTVCFYSLVPACVRNLLKNFFLYFCVFEPVERVLPTVLESGVRESLN